MIKLTGIQGPPTSPTLVLIPGGPGISTLSIRAMDILSRSVQQLYVDFPGTYRNPTEECFKAVVENFENRKPPALFAAKKIFDSQPSDKTFALWLSEYGELYFSTEKDAAPGGFSFEVIQGSSHFVMFDTMRCLQSGWL